MLHLLYHIIKVLRGSRSRDCNKCKYYIEHEPKDKSKLRYIALYPDCEKGVATLIEKGDVKEGKCNKFKESK